MTNQSQTVSQQQSSDVQATGNKPPMLAYLSQNKRLFIIVMLFVWVVSSMITLISYEPTYVANSLAMIKDTALTAKYVTGDNYETTTSQSTSSVINTMGLLKAETYKKRLWEFFSAQHPQELSKRNIENYLDWSNFYGDGSALMGYGNAPGTDLIELQFKWSDPKIAKEGLQVVIATFKELSMNLNKSEQSERGQYLLSQIQDIQFRLTAVRNKISQVKEQNQIIDLTEENANLARVRLNLKTDVRTVGAEARGKMQQLAGYQSLLGMSAGQAVTASAIGRNEVLSKLQSELYGLRLERNSLLTRYTESSVKVQDIDSRIEQLESNINKELTRTVGKSRAASLSSANNDSMAVADSTRGDAVSRMINAKTDALELGTRSRALQQYVNELDARAVKLNRVSAQLSDYKLEEATLDESLKILKEKEIDANLKETQTLSNVFVVEEPQIPLKPAFPTQKHLLIINFLLGIAFGLAAVFIKYMLPEGIGQRIAYQPSQVNTSNVGSTQMKTPELPPDVNFNPPQNAVLTKTVLAPPPVFVDSMQATPRAGIPPAPGNPLNRPPSYAAATVNGYAQNNLPTGGSRSVPKPHFPPPIHPGQRVNNLPASEYYSGLSKNVTNN